MLSHFLVIRVCILYNELGSVPISRKTKSRSRGDAVTFFIEFDIADVEGVACDRPDHVLRSVMRNS